MASDVHERRSNRSNIVRRVKATSKAGFAIGSALGIWMFVLAVAAGSLSVPFKGSKINAVAAILGYLCGGTAAGAIAGLLAPLARSRLGVAILGVVSLLPLSVMVMLVLFPLRTWSEVQVLSALILSLGLGSPLGIIYREIFREEIEREFGAVTDNSRKGKGHV